MQKEVVRMCRSLGKMSVWIGLLLCFDLEPGFAQSELVLEDGFQPKRFWLVTGTGAVIYTATVIGLNSAWYQNHERSSFHLFNDWNEWQNMDKMGHAFTTYFESELCFRGALWTGLSHRKAVWSGVGAALLLQSTVEMLDGFSSKWGFSIHDMAFNLAGSALFASQELMWKEQRIRLKVSSTIRKYSPDLIASQNNLASSSLANRADALFGSSFLERYLKDYNAQTIWLSSNPNSLLKLDKWPKWLNIAVGYGSENLFGGYENSWMEEEHLFVLHPDEFRRSKQWYLSPDVDLTRIKSNSKWIKTALRILNIFKMPAPAIELNSRGKLIFHWVHL